ncbi:MMS19 nucleotide excision repair protein-like protein [Frankliniella fusca]|uniref:MMS19 nucleotide excision repair protein n=1 Tax=Frankliniella fusca TaxID=407009 RepID=A0AAE1LL90_9NEOP|nr:MMS19 nucleotide excision repair protein-like protein [Frankliniella fusca]
MAAHWSKDSLIEEIKTNPDFCEKCPLIAQDISQRNLNLLTLVENLKDVLTDPEPSRRAVGTLVLATVLRDLPMDFVREDELKFITAFFCDRLKDHHDVIPAALKGILAILHMKNIAKESPAEILRSLVLNLNCQGQRHEDRLVIYRTLDLLVLPHISSLQGLGPDLVYHIMTAVEGERDPRNLKFLFSMLPSIIKSLSLGHLTEDFFEIVACYFPVDFNPSPEQRSQINREQLATGLANVLTATPNFAEFAFPLALEKLDSPIRLAKMDSLHLLTKGFEEFPPEKVAVHISPIWESLSREALQGSDYEVRESSRRAVTQLLRCLADSPSANEGHSNPMRQLLSDVVAASTSCLSEIHTSLFMPAADLLLAAAKSGPPACEYILRKVLPSVVDFFHTKNDAADRSIYLRIISRFLTVCKSFEVTPLGNPEINPQWNLLLQLYFSSAEHDSNLELKEALFGLTTLTPTLSKSERERLYNLLSNFIDISNSTEVREQCRLCLCEICTDFPNEVLECILPEKLNLSGFDMADCKFDRRMQAHCWLAAVPPFSQKVLPNVLQIILKSKHLHQIQASLSALRKLFQDIPQSADENHHVYESFMISCDNAVARLIFWWTESVNGKENDWVKNETIFNDVCFIISNVTQNISSQHQELVVQKTLPLLNTFCATFDPCSKKHQQEVIEIFEAVFGCLYCSISMPDLRALCCSLYKISVVTQFERVHTSSSRLCASIINKLPLASLEETLLDLKALLQQSCMTQGSIQDAAQSASFCGWIVKGLSMRGYINLEVWVDMLIEYMASENTNIAVSAARAFRIIMTDNPTYLNEKSHCIIRLLHKQRVFLYSLKIVSKAKQSPKEQRYPYMLAVTNLLAGVSQIVLSSNIGEVLPLLLESLSQNDSPVLVEPALHTLNDLLTQPDFYDSLNDHVQTIINRLLPLTTHESSMMIRRIALRCLFNVANLKTELLLPFRPEVLDKLTTCVGDSKRFVRQDAVAARSHWLSISWSSKK